MLSGSPSCPTVSRTPSCDCHHHPPPRPTHPSYILCACPWGRVAQPGQALGPQPWCQALWQWHHPLPGLAIDFPESKLYWISSRNHTINRCNLDGTELEVINTMWNQLGKATALAIMGEGR